MNLWLDFYVLYNGGSGLQWLGGGWLSGGEQIVDQRVDKEKESVRWRRRDRKSVV